MKFSIITPVYNRADCIERCIKSVINQKHSQDFGWECEHIIVNDGSKDNTDEIVKEYLKKYSHIVYINFVDNKGTNAARNAAIKNATGDFCIILDSDDFFVENALDIICEKIRCAPVYKHYMFAPDDRKDFFDNNKDLNKEKIITFKDFLSQKYSGDFIHVIRKETMQKYPFDESLRIYEGVFFLKFYKEAQQIYFTNTVVTIRERGREDSVTKEYIMTQKSSIMNSIKAMEIKLNWYKKDYIELGLTNIINSIYIRLMNNYLLIGDYKRSRDIIKRSKEDNLTLPFYIKLIHYLRLGGVFRFLLFTSLKFKYNIVKSKVK